MAKIQPVNIIAALWLPLSFAREWVIRRGRIGSLRRLAAVSLVLLLIAGCAAQRTAEDKEDFQDEEIADPIEPLNRVFFDFNQFLDTLLVRPAAELYRKLLPEPVRDSVRNFLRNLGSPVVFFNDLLQGEGKRAETTFNRFLINTTLGVAGLFDVAFDMGHPYHNEDFGQTLAVWGADEGIYLVLPILGPSTTRDATGIVVDIFLDPLTYVAVGYDIEEWFYPRRIVGGIDARSRNIESLDQLKKESLDFYSLIRSIYQQHRQSQIRNGRPLDESPASKLEEDRDK